MFNTIEEIKQQDFIGFIKMHELLKYQSRIPESPGVYLVLYLDINIPVFINPGSGGHFKFKDPNVSHEILLRNWIKDTIVIYIGKAGSSGSDATLKKRLRRI